MKDPVAMLSRSLSAWRALRCYPGVFSLRDACRHLRYVVQPDRITEWEFRRFVRKELSISPSDDGARHIRLKRHDLSFYWLGSVAGGLGNGVLQELDQAHPHHYTTPPIHLKASSVVLDVGACEGLFAFRVLKSGQAARVICFEPSARTASFLKRGAETNGVADKVQIENAAVGLKSAEVYFSDGDIPEGNSVAEEPIPGAKKVRQVSLDDFCRDQGLRLKPEDLIKVDAEGADVDVIRGAERIIREGSPQIAVTTYHDPLHAKKLVEFLRAAQPRYRFRLKGLVIWGPGRIPRPVLLQVALPETARAA